MPTACPYAGAMSAGESDQDLLEECDVQSLRHSGPGGQHRNKTETGVRLVHRPTGIVVTAFEERSQLRNREAALRRLKAALALHVRSDVDLEGYKPSPALRTILPHAAQQVRANNERFWPGVADLLDVFVACNCEVAATAAVLAISTGALSRLLLSEPRLAARVNALRAERSLRPLRA